MKTNIALIGFMGVGKSAVGKVLAERLGKELIDTDSLVVKKAGKSIPQIFQEEGEPAFRKLESQIIIEIASRQNQVIACGGGVILNKTNVERLHSSSVIVWLVASPEVICERVRCDGEGRPLLRGKNNVESIRELLEVRDPLYQAAADIKIDTSGILISTLTRQIIEKLKQHADFDSKE